MLLVFNFFLASFFSAVFCAQAEERLMADVFRGYNNLILPVKNNSQLPMTVKVALQVQLLINVQWTDFQMKWNPLEYDDIGIIRVPPDKVWVPDVVLFNNADGRFEVGFMCNVVIESDGQMLWVPPAIYKSSCIIDVEFFPFDEQVCDMVFGSWTYNSKEVVLDFVSIPGADLSVYMNSSIWDIADAPASLVNDRSRIEFQLKIRRKPLFYTVVLIIPTVIMAFLSMAVYFLPTDSTEKMTLTISILFSIVVFLLLLTKILPPTSSTIPLMAKYLLLTFVLNVITILVTVVIVNVYFRGQNTHRMPHWVRQVFLEFLPKFICMKPPKTIIKHNERARMSSTLAGLEKYSLNSLNSLTSHHPHCSNQESLEFLTPKPNNSSLKPFLCASKSPSILPQEAHKAVDAIEFITQNLKQKEENTLNRDDWRFVGIVLDRLMLYLFFGVTLGGTIGILTSSDHIFDVVDQYAVVEKYNPNNYKDKPWIPNE